MRPCGGGLAARAAPPRPGTGLALARPGSASAGLAISLSIAAGAELGGVVGALLGIPFAGALKVVSSELVAWRRGENAPA